MSSSVPVFGGIAVLGSNANYIGAFAGRAAFARLSNRVPIIGPVAPQHGFAEQLTRTDTDKGH